MGIRTARSVGFCALALLLIAGACTHPISRNLRKEAQKDSIPFTTVLAEPDAAKGKIVLWGGRIIQTTNLKDGSEIIVLETPLDFLGLPDEAESSRGRFIARSTEFLDPAIYSPDRKITLAGKIVGAEERTLGETTYRYPVADIQELYLWEKPGPEDYIHTWGGPYWGPWPGPYYYY